LSLNVLNECVYVDVFVGFRWQRQLVFRSKLTMHTAFERKDNKDPAAVTAVAISRYVIGKQN